MNRFDLARAADDRHSIRRCIIAEIAAAIRTGMLAEVQAKYPGIPAMVMAEAEKAAAQAEAEAWWKAISTSLPPA